MLAQEPWCASPEFVANLTNWQLEHVYRRPAEERARRLRAEMQPAGFDAAGVDAPETAGADVLPGLERVLEIATMLGKNTDAVAAAYRETQRG